MSNNFTQKQGYFKRKYHKKPSKRDIDAALMSMHILSGNVNKREVNPGNAKISKTCNGNKRIYNT